MIIENKILDISENHYDYLMSLENVTGIGLGYKHINKIDTLEPCIHVLVEKKVDNKNISTNNLIPKTYMGIKTDVIEIGKFSVCGLKNTNALPQKIRPLQGGFGIRADYRGTGLGTLGCIVTKKVNDSREYFILSNNHVLANANKVPIGTPIVQPGDVSDWDAPNFIVAYLSEYIPVKYTGFLKSPANYIDAAIARLSNKRLATSKIFGIGKVKGVNKPILNLPIKKVGLASGISYGTIKTIGANLTIEFEKNKNVKFKKQVLADIFAKPGDSGSVVLNNNNEVIGLFMAATTATNLNLSDSSIFSDIRNVLDAFNISIFVQ